MVLKLSRSAPCATCPYRKASPCGLWHRSEFENLVRQDANIFTGHLFVCHSDGKNPEGQRELCVGWLLDQRRRGVPSIPLRLALLNAPDVAERFGNLRDDPRRYYTSIAAMCRANGVRLPVVR